MDLNKLPWRKARRSGGNGGDCVQVVAVDDSMAGFDDFVAEHASHKPGHHKYFLLADTKTNLPVPNVFTPAEWAYFEEAVRNDEFGDL